MNDTFAPSARPTWAAIAWATKEEIFVEIPCKNGPPYICRYKKSTQGLAAALNIMVSNPSERKRAVDDHPNIKRPIPKFTESQRETTRNILKRLKIT